MGNHQSLISRNVRGLLNEIRIGTSEILSWPLHSPICRLFASLCLHVGACNLKPLVSAFYSYQVRQPFLVGLASPDISHYMYQKFVTVHTSQIAAKFFLNRFLKPATCLSLSEQANFPDESNFYAHCINWTTYPSRSFRGQSSFIATFDPPLNFCFS